MVEADQDKSEYFMRVFPPLNKAWSTVMSMNMGRLDQYVRIVLGLALVAFAFKDGLFIEGWQWFGLAGFVLLATAFFRSCPAYTVLGISTRERRI